MGKLDKKVETSECIVSLHLLFLPLYLVLLNIKEYTLQLNEQNKMNSLKGNSK